MIESTLESTLMSTLSYQKKLWHCIQASLLLVLAINVISLYQNRQQTQQQNRQVPLQQAKQYLLQYAKQQGELPCVDGNGDGYSDTHPVMTNDVITDKAIIDKAITDNSTAYSQASFTCQYLIGWLPDKTIQQPQLRDEEGQRFWYSKALHADQRLQINGQAMALAVVISAGPAMPWQTARRPLNSEHPRLPLQPELYLEASNPQQQWQAFSSLGSNNSNNSNDRLIWISHHDWPNP
jgi:hypothetical protein